MRPLGPFVFFYCSDPVVYPSFDIYPAIKGAVVKTETAGQ